MSPWLAGLLGLNLGLFLAVPNVVSALAVLMVLALLVGERLAG